MSEAVVPRRLVVVDGRVLLQACTLYKRHPCAVLNLHHVVPKSWWVAAGKPVASPVRALCPNCHSQGALTKLDRYLHDRTGGMIGALSHQVRGAAVDAILSGTEKITKKGLTAVPLDYSAQQSASGHRG